MRSKISIHTWLAAVMLLIISAPVSLLLVYQAKLCYNRFEILEKLEEESLHTITVSPDELHWVIPGKELRIGERLFDVKNMNQCGNDYLFTGIFDDEEDELEKQISNRSSPGKSKLPLLMKLSIFPVLPPEMPAYSPFSMPKEKSDNPGYLPILAINFSKPAGPPPRSRA